MSIRKKNRWHGRCHCGALRFTFESYLKPEDLPLRSCTCSFCLKHGTRCTSDPRGKISFKVKRDSLSSHQSKRTTKRILCKKCGVYLGMILRNARKMYATVNVNT